MIIEAVDANFGKKFWEYVKQAGYEHCNKSNKGDFYHIVWLSLGSAFLCLGSTHKKKENNQTNTNDK